MQWADFFMNIFVGLMIFAIMNCFKNFGNFLTSVFEFFVKHGVFYKRFLFIMPVGGYKDFGYWAAFWLSDE